MSQSQEVNHEKLMNLFGNVFSHISGAVGLMMSYLGDQTGSVCKDRRIGVLLGQDISRSYRHG